MITLSLLLPMYQNNKKGYKGLHMKKVNARIVYFNFYLSRYCLYL